MKLVLLITLLFFESVCFVTTNDWGKTGHRATGEIAAGYLTPSAKEKIHGLLGGKSLALVSTFADEIKSDPRYREYSPWHYVNIPFDKTYREIEKNPKGDLIMGIKKCLEVLKNEKAGKEEKVFHLKLLVHFMGDLHQPMHFGLKEDRGGNDFYLRWFGEGTNLHRVWDSDMINNYQMSYSELAANQAELSGKELKKMKAGSLLDWAGESHRIAKKIYATADEGDELGYEYMYEWFPTVRQQLQKGGVRLAKLLNELFG